MHKIYTLITILFFTTTQLFAQCPAGQANVTIKVYGDQFVDTESGITCTINGTAVALTPTNFSATTTTRWHTFTVPCTTVGGNIVVNLTDGWPDGIGPGIGAAGTNVRIYVNNELVDSLSFNSGASASTSTHGTPFTTNAQSNATCTTSKPSGVAQFSLGSPWPPTEAEVIANTPGAAYNGFEYISGVPVTKCGTFTATSIATAVYSSFLNYVIQPGTGGGSSTGSSTMQLYNALTCAPIGGAIVGNGSVINLIPGQTYVLCGTRTLNANTNAPSQESVANRLYLFTRRISILPVTLKEFYGIGSTDFNKLIWTTAAGGNIGNFELQKSSDGNTFTKIYTTTSTNTNNSFFDANPYYGNNFYRLKITSNDGSVTYSSVVTLNNSGTKTKLANIYPNPASNYIELEFTSHQASKVQYSVVNALGKQLLNATAKVSAGITKVKLDVTSYPAGLYLIKVHNAQDNTVELQKFIKL
jgi:hypothetical protein